MHSKSSDSPKLETDSDTEITFYDMVLFLSKAWKKLLASLLIGASLGLGFGFLIGTYSAEYIFFNRIQNVLQDPISTRQENNADLGIAPNLNASRFANANPASSISPKGGTQSGVNTNQQFNANAYALDLASWKAVQKSLPNLAAQMISAGSVSEDQRAMYKDLADDSWWRKNVVPNFLAISKVDTKDLAGTIKDLEPQNFVLMSLTITETGRTAESALKNAQGAADFLRFGSAFIQVRNVLNSYESEVIGSTAEIQKQMTSTNIEIAFLLERLNQLEDLRKRFPDSSAAGQLLLDPKESGAKYLPLTTQIIATKQEINQSRENIERLNRRLIQLGLIEQFLVEAKASASQTFNGLSLITNLLSIEKKLRTTLPTNSPSSVEILDQLRAQFLQIQGRFSGGLEPIPTIKSTGLIKAILAGSITGFLLTLFWLLGRQSWLTAKRHIPQGQ